MAADIFYEYDPEGVNEIIDEAQGSDNFMAMRMVRWKPTSEFKLDIRKYFVKADGSEFPGKGISFMTEDGPHALVETMTAYGYGRTENMINMLSAREDFVESLARATVDKREDFVKSLNSAYDEVVKDSANRVVNAKEMLSQLL